MTILCCLLIIPLFFTGAIYRRFLNDESNDKNKGNIHDDAKNGQLEKIVYLIHKDPSQINRKDADGDTALIRAARNGHLDVVQYLVAQDAKIDMQNNYGHTTLAACYGHLDVVQYLVGKGANKDAQNNVGDTALICAYKGHLNTVQYLVGKGADTNIRGEKDQTALQWAKEKSRSNVEAFLGNKNNVTYPSVIATPIHVTSLKSSSFSDLKNQTVITPSTNNIFIAAPDSAPSAPSLESFKT